jgi:hypothetical protein
MPLRFEGQEVDGGSEIDMRTFKGPIDSPLVQGENVRLTVIAYVEQVNHKEGKDGKLYRSHVVRVKDVIPE